MGEYAGRIYSPLPYESAFSQHAKAVVLNEIGGSAFLRLLGIDDWGRKCNVLNKSFLPIYGIHGRFFGPRMPREIREVLDGHFCSASLRICVSVALAPSLEQSQLRMLVGSVHALRGMPGLQEYEEVLMEIYTLMIRRETSLTWTQALLSKAYRQGFRLTSQAPALYEAILAIGRDGEISYRALFDVVRTVMSILVRRDSADFNVRQRTWREALAIVVGTGSDYCRGHSGAQCLIPTK